MNYKLLFPTYRNRYRFVRSQLAAYAKQQKFAMALNLGAGEGDYDPMISPFTDQLISCDLNQADVAFARSANAQLPNVTYQVENALALSFPDNHFDLIVSVEVIEHVGQPEQMLSEIKRVLKPGGVLIMTFPRQEFPWTYDPINKLLLTTSGRKISQGAYAFGHEYLIVDRVFQGWVADLSLQQQQRRNLGGYLVGLLEIYWTGLVQRLFKANSTNLEGEVVKDRTFKLRPSTKEPALVSIVDGILGLDYMLFGSAKNSIGLGYVLKKEDNK